MERTSCAWYVCICVGLRWVDVYTCLCYVGFSLQLLQIWCSVFHHCIVYLSISLSLPLSSSSSSSHSGGAAAASGAFNFFAKTLQKIAPRFASIKELSRADVARLMEVMYLSSDTIFLSLLFCRCLFGFLQSHVDVSQYVCVNGCFVCVLV